MATQGAKYKQWMQSNVKDFTNKNGDVNMTELAECCADNFNVITDDGESEEETIIFEIATAFFKG
jgi:hypothetical protein